MKAVFLGLSATSSWGNGHATNYRGLVGALRGRGHDVLFLERDRPWYADARDFTAPWIRLYDDLDELARWQDEVSAANLVLVGSYVPDGCDVAEWVLDRARGVTAFWDIYTPVTVAKLARGDYEKLVHPQVQSYFRDVYDHLLKVIGTLDGFRDMLTSVLEANLTQISVRQNDDMRKISAWVAIAVVPTMIAGIYGMNFDHMPELRWRFGYPAVIVVILLICSLLYRYFKKVGWL